MQFRASRFAQLAGFSVDSFRPSIDNRNWYVFRLPYVIVVEKIYKT